MKTAKTLANLAVLALGLWLIPSAGGQTAPNGQKPPAKAKSAKVAKTHKPAVAAPANQEAAKPAPEKSEPLVSRRDPFEPLVYVAQPGSAEHLPPGKAGLVIATVRVDGAVKSPNGMIAVVSNPQERVYFVREGDRLYDGNVEKISLDGVTFKENSKDAFGKPVERLVTKRIYPSAGEQQ
jgi:hypothetical protein